MVSSFYGFNTSEKFSHSRNVKLGIFSLYFIFGSTGLLKKIFPLGDSRQIKFKLY